MSKRRRISRLAGAFAVVCCATVVGCLRLEPDLQRVRLERPAFSVDPALEVGGAWSGFRGGPQHGVAGEGPLPLQWDDQQGVRWAASLDGRGCSSPVVWGQRIWLTVELDQAAASSNVWLLCLHRDDGRELWRRDLGASQSRSHRKNGHASATVACDGQSVFVSCGSGGLLAFEHSGQRRWRVPLGELDHQWGQATSPVVFGDSVLQLCDSESGSYLAAFDAATGSVRWKVERDSYGCWSTPVLVPGESDGAADWELVVNGTGSHDGAAGFVIGYDPATGAELWRVRGTTDIPCPTAIYGSGLIVSSSGGNGPVFAIRPGGRGDVADSHVAWRRPSGGPYVPTGVVYRDRLFLVTDGGRLSCHRIEDGSIVWRKRISGTYSASLIAGGGHIYAVSEQGDVHVIEAADEFRKVSVNRLRERCLATPAAADGLLFVRTDHRLICIGGPMLTPVNTTAPNAASEGMSDDTSAEHRPELSEVDERSLSDRPVSRASAVDAEPTSGDRKADLSSRLRKGRRNSVAEPPAPVSSAASVVSAVDADNEESGAESGENPTVEVVE